MNQKHLIILAVAAAAGYFLSDSINSYAGAYQAYKLGYNFGHGDGISVA